MDGCGNINRNYQKMIKNLDVAIYYDDKHKFKRLPTLSFSATIFDCKSVKDKGFGSLEKENILIRTLSIIETGFTRVMESLVIMTIWTGNGFLIIVRCRIEFIR